MITKKSQCRCCNSIAESAFKGTLFGIEIQYFECVNCGYVQTEPPHWLTKAYSSAINDCDTGIMQRNISNAKITLGTLALLGSKDGTVVDYAGGYGILVRLLRDYGVDALWTDPYCKNLLAKGFEHHNENASLVTAFEAFEHFINPCDEVNKLFDISPNILISTSLVPTPTPRQNEWWYYGKEHGQHIGFYREKTLSYIAKKFGKNLVSDGHSYHLFTDIKINVSKWKITKKIALNLPWLYYRNLQSKTLQDNNRHSKDENCF